MSGSPAQERQVAFAPRLRAPDCRQEGGVCSEAAIEVAGYSETFERSIDLSPLAINGFVATNLTPPNDAKLIEFNVLWVVLTAIGYFAWMHFVVWLLCRSGGC